MVPENGHFQEPGVKGHRSPKVWAGQCRLSVASATDPSGLRPNQRRRCASSLRPCRISRSASRKSSPSPAAARACRICMASSISPWPASSSASREAARGSPASARARSSPTSPRSASRSASRSAALLVAGVGAGAQFAGRPCLASRLARWWRHFGRQRRRGPAARPGPPGLEQPGQPPGGYQSPASARAQSSSRSPRLRAVRPAGRRRPVAGVGAGAQFADVALVGQQIGQLVGGASSPASARVCRTCRALSLSPPSASSSASRPAAIQSPVSARARSSPMSPRSASRSASRTAALGRRRRRGPAARPGPRGLGSSMASRRRR